MESRAAVEIFHLVFLRHFSSTVSPGTICLKGGVNLRLYHNSPRLSEDMDFDARKVGVEILKKNVNKVLTGRPLLSELAASGIGLRSSRQSAELKHLTSPPAAQTSEAQKPLPAPISRSGPSEASRRTAAALGTLHQKSRRT